MASVTNDKENLRIKKILKVTETSNFPRDGEREREIERWGERERGSKREQLNQTPRGSFQALRFIHIATFLLDSPHLCLHLCHQAVPIWEPTARHLDFCLALIHCYDLLCWMEGGRTNSKIHKTLYPILQLKASALRSGMRFCKES